MTDVDRVNRMVLDQIRQRFGSSVTIEDVEIDEDVDHDGDPILRVRVYYTNTGGALPPREKVAGMVRHLRPALAQIGEPRFPILSFIDAGERAAAS